MSKSFLKELLFLAYDKSLESNPQAMREAWSKSMKDHGIPIPEWENMTQIDRDESIYLALKASGADAFARKNIYPLLDRRIWIPHPPLELTNLSQKTTASVIKNNKIPEVVSQISSATPEATPNPSIKAIEPVVLASAMPALLKVVNNATTDGIVDSDLDATKVIQGADHVHELSVEGSKDASHTLHLKDVATLKAVNQTTETKTVFVDDVLLASVKSGPKDVEQIQQNPVMGSALTASTPEHVSAIEPIINTPAEPVDRREKKYSPVDSQTECEFILSRSEVIGAVTIGPMIIDGKELSPVGYRVLFDQKSKSFSIVENRGEVMRLFECPRAKKFLDATLSVQIRDEYGRCQHVGLGHLRGGELLFKIEEIDKQFIQFSCFLDKNAAYFKYLEPKSETVSQGLRLEAPEPLKVEAVKIRLPDPVISSVRAKEGDLPPVNFPRESPYRSVRAPQSQIRSKTQNHQASYVPPVASLLQHVARPKAQPVQNEYKAEANWDSDEELTDEDLARLRGELPMEPVYPRHR